MGHCVEYSRQDKTEEEFAVIGERRNDHNVVIKTPIPMPQPFGDREVVARCLWKQVDEATYFLAQTSCEHLDFPLRPGVVRMGFERTVKLTKVSPKLTLVEWSTDLDFAGSVPRRVNDAIMVSKVVRTQINFAKFFTCLRPADLFDEEDGTKLGQILFLQLHKHRKNKDFLNEKILDEIRTTNVLRSAQAKYR
jgi:hypothetical protein